MSGPRSYRGRPGGYGEVVRIAWPLIVSTGSFTVMQFVDRVFLAWHSPVSIQAALPGGILSFTLICAFMALAGYANTFVAQYHGAGDREGCSLATAQGVWMSLISWPLMLALIPPGLWILELSGHAPDVLAEEKSYFLILMAGGVHIPLTAAISSFFTGRGDTFTNMIAAVAGNAFNIILDYALIFGKFGFPALGIEGAAIATVVSGFIPAGILFALYLRRQAREEYGTARNWRLEPRLFGRMIRFGLPSGVHMLVDVASFTVFVLIVGRMGAEELAVSNIALSINMVAFMPLVGISIAATTLVGQYQGRGDAATAARAGWTSFRVGVIYMLVIAATYVLAPEFYYGLFAGKSDGLHLEDLMPLGRPLLAMLAAWGVVDAANLILSGALKGAGDTRFVVWYSTGMAWIVWVPVLWWVADVADMGLMWAWGWTTAYIIILSAGYVWRFHSGVWKSIDLLGCPAPVPPVAHIGEETSTVGDV